jgi:hypothetical protein
LYAAAYLLRRNLQASSRGWHRYCASLAERLKIGNAQSFGGRSRDEDARAAQQLTHLDGI